MILRFFPGFGPAVSVITVVPPPVVPPVWQTVTGAAQRWISSAGVGLVPRLEHMYPQTALAFGQPVTFVHRVQQEFPSLVATGNEVLIDSGATL